MSPTTQGWFMMNVAPLLLTFLALVIPAVGAWIVAALRANMKKLESNHAENIVANRAATLAATQAAVTAQVANSKMDTVITQTNGVTDKLQEHIKSQADVIAALAKGTPAAATDC